MATGNNTNVSNEIIGYKIQCLKCENELNPIIMGENDFITIANLGTEISIKCSNCGNEIVIQNSELEV